MRRVAIRTDDMLVTQETTPVDVLFTAICWETADVVWLMLSCWLFGLVLENLIICDLTILDSNLLLRLAGSVSFVRFSSVPFNFGVVVDPLQLAALATLELGLMGFSGLGFAEINSAPSFVLLLLHSCVLFVTAAGVSVL